MINSLHAISREESLYCSTNHQKRWRSPFDVGFLGNHFVLSEVTETLPPEL